MMTLESAFLMRRQVAYLALATRRRIIIGQGWMVLLMLVIALAAL